MQFPKISEGGGLNYDLYIHCLHDSKTDLRMYKRREQVRNIYIYIHIYIYEAQMGERGRLGVGVPPPNLIGEQ